MAFGHKDMPTGPVGHVAYGTTCQALLRKAHKMSIGYSIVCQYISYAYDWLYHRLAPVLMPIFLKEILLK